MSPNEKISHACFIGIPTAVYCTAESTVYISQ